MTAAYPQGHGIPRPFTARRSRPIAPGASVEAAAEQRDVPDHHSQLEELLGHVRRCERWARLDDRIDLSWRLGGNH
jgi:hypothetical protein